MTALAQEVGAVNVSQGFPDFNPPEALVSAVSQAMIDGFNQYAPMPGLLSLREVVASKYHHLLSCHVDPETEVTITPGGTAAIFTALAALVGPGDRVMIFDPAYDSYAPSVITLGGTVVRLPLNAPSYLPDWQRVKEMITPDTKAVIINNPHNPSGAVWSADDVATLGAICDNVGCYVIADEVYDLITFEKPHVSVLSEPLLRNRSFVISSFGKLIHATGWKVGACVASAELTKEFRKVHQFINFSVNTPAQQGLATFLQSLQSLTDLAPFLNKKRMILEESLHGSLWKRRVCYGTYFQLIDYADFWDGTDVDLARLLTTKYGVATIPLSPFTNDEQRDTALRVCFAKQDHIIRLAGERLAQASLELGSQKV